MLAWRTAIVPSASNSQFSLPYERNHWPLVVVPLVGEAHRDAVAAERPQLLDQPVVELLRPLAGQERDDLGSRPARNSSRLRQRLSGE